MTIELKPEQSHVIDLAIAAGLIERADEVVDVGLGTLRSLLERRMAPEHLSREEAIHRMQEFGDKYRLTLGEPITRKLLHEKHRF